MSRDSCAAGQDSLDPKVRCNVSLCQVHTRPEDPVQMGSLLVIDSPNAM